MRHEPVVTETQNNSTVGFTAMEDGVNVESTGRFFCEVDAVIADAEAQLSGVAFELLDVTLAGLGEAMEGGEDAHGSLAVDAADVGARRWGKDDLLNASSSQRLRSLGERPNSRRISS